MSIILLNWMCNFVNRVEFTCKWDWINKFQKKLTVETLIFFYFLFFFCPKNFNSVSQSHVVMPKKKKTKSSWLCSFSDCCIRLRIGVVNFNDSLKLCFGSFWYQKQMHHHDHDHLLLLEIHKQQSFQHKMVNNMNNFLKNVDQILLLLHNISKNQIRQYYFDDLLLM